MSFTSPQTCVAHSQSLFRRTCPMEAKSHPLRVILMVGGFTVPLALSAASPADEKTFRPEIEQLQQTICERLQAAADKLGLTKEQQTKIGEIRAANADKFKDLREQRSKLLEAELNAINSI